VEGSWLSQTMELRPLLRTTRKCSILVSWVLKYLASTLSLSESITILFSQYCQWRWQTFPLHNTQHNYVSKVPHACLYLSPEWANNDDLFKGNK
jgi:hypothetical protein